MSVFKDTRILVSRTVTMVDQICSGGQVETNSSYHNYSTEVPAYLCKALVVDADNYWRNNFV